MYFLDTGDTYINELQIRNNYNLGEGDKVTDFYVSNSFGNVYIECKAIFAHPLTKVLPTSDILIKSYNDSIIKAVVQGLSTHAYRKSLHYYIL
jgi:hypothetical protein